MNKDSNFNVKLETWAMIILSPHIHHDIVCIYEPRAINQIVNRQV